MKEQTAEILTFMKENPEMFPGGGPKNLQTNMAWFKEYNGGYKCSKCGYDVCERAIEFHHTNPKQKEGQYDTFFRWVRRSPKWFQEKIRKTTYVLLCANCHRELHSGMWELDKHADIKQRKHDPSIKLWGRGKYGV